MSKNKKRISKDLSFTLKVDPTKVRLFSQPGDFERYVASIRCGNTVHKPKKGKGSYRRHPKHKKKVVDWD